MMMIMTDITLCLYAQVKSLLLNASDKYTISFTQERYGGVSFGHRRPDLPFSYDSEYNLNLNDSTPPIAVQEGAKAWFTYKGYHSMPAFLNTLNNAILRANVPADNMTNYGNVSYYYVEDINIYV